MRVIISLLAILLAGQLIAQVRPSGLLLEDALYDSIPILVINEGQKSNDLPDQVSLRDYCPIPGNQGQNGSCVAWACGYGALTIEHAIRQELNNNIEVTKMAKSVAFIYNQIKEDGDCETGAKFSSALKLLKEKGDCLALSFPVQNCNISPSKNNIKEAADYRIQNYAAIFKREDRPENKIRMTRQILAKKSPLIIGMALPISFYNINEGELKWSPKEDEIIIDYHAMVVVGYDVLKKEFMLMNSFGSEWGDRGFIKISFEDYGRLVRYAYQLLIDDYVELVNPNTFITTSERKAGAGQININASVELVTIHESNNQFNYRTTPVSYQSNLSYKSESLIKGQIYQLQVKRPDPEYNVYCITWDVNCKATLHYDQTDLHTSNKITLPSEESAFQLSNGKSESVLVLMSNYPIETLKDRVDLLSGHQIINYGLVKEIFGEELLGLKRAGMADLNISLNLSISNKEQIIIPVLISIPVI